MCVNCVCCSRVRVRAFYRYALASVHRTTGTAVPHSAGRSWTLKAMWLKVPTGPVCIIWFLNLPVYRNFLNETIWSYFLIGLGLWEA